MSNHEIFLMPGALLYKLLASILNIDVSGVSDELTVFWTFCLALIFWWQACSAIVAWVKKKFGFYQGGQQR